MGGMTALTQYERLEGPGLYTPAAGAQRKDVILSLGHASLTISDHREVALAHWSLAALERINPGSMPAIYAPGPTSDERIETPDDTLIAAIEKVRAAVERGRPHPGRLRGRLVVIIAVLIAVLALFWLPRALVLTTARIVPEAAEGRIGAALLDDISRLAGRPCSEPRGSAGLSQLLAALAPHGPQQAVVLPGGPPGTRSLPGGAVLMSRTLVEDHETPEVAAGFLLAEAERQNTTDPMTELLEHAGVVATLRLATTGELPGGALRSYAQTLMVAPPQPVSPEALAPRFAAAGVPLTPYAYALDMTGETTLPLIEADPVTDAGAARLLSDLDWVALQEICGG